MKRRLIVTMNVVVAIKIDFKIYRIFLECFISLQMCKCDRVY